VRIQFSLRRLLILLPATVLFGGTVAFATSLTVASAKLTVFTSCTLDYSSGGIDDAYVQQDAPTSAHNTTALDVKSDGGTKNQYTYIKFANLLSSCPALSGADVRSATLTLVMTTATARAKTYTVSQVDPAATWTQTTLMWNNKPAVVSTTSTFPSGTTTGAKTADVTSDVALFAAGTTNKGWRIADLVTTTNDLGAFASAEYTTNTANRPKLTIGYIH
jgi:hypothetical protein